MVLLKSLHVTQDWPIRIFPNMLQILTDMTETHKRDGHTYRKRDEVRWLEREMQKLDFQNETET